MPMNTLLIAQITFNPIRINSLKKKILTLNILKNNHEFLPLLPDLRLYFTVIILPIKNTGNSPLPKERKKGREKERKKEKEKNLFFSV